MPTHRVDFKHVRTNADFEVVAAHYNLALVGRNEQRSALCCFHDEDTPSLKIHLGKKAFNCFGCGKHGNILDFVTLMEGGDPENDKDLRAGAFKLAEICGIDPVPGKSAATPITKTAAAKADAERPSMTGKQTEKVQPLHGNKPLSFELKLDLDYPYLKERVSRNIIESFGLGYCSRGMMKGRIAIPIHNEKGELIAYAGRWAEKDVPNGTPRYLLPDGFEKQSVLFNLHRLPDWRVTKDRARVVLVESYWSVFKLHELGIPAVSPMGHSVCQRQCELLAARGVKEVVILFDGDDAGAQGIVESAPPLARHFYVHAPAVPDGFKPHRCENHAIRDLLSD